MTNSIQDRQVAMRYAQALLDLSVDDVQYDVVAEELATLVVLMQESNAFDTVCHSPLVTKRDKVAAVEIVAQSASLSTITTKFLRTLAYNNRLDILPVISDVFAMLCRAHRGEMDADVTTARLLSKSDEKTIAVALKNAFKKPVHMVLHVDARLIGGIKIKVGSRELDASVQGKLARVTQRLYDSIQIN